MGCADRHDDVRARQQEAAVRVQGRGAARAGAEDRSGVDVAKPGGTEYYWETLSWEQIGKYPVDLFLYSERAMPPEGLRRIATFASLPAVRAGQLRPWKFASMDYVDQAKAMSQLAGWLNSAKKVA